MKKKNNIPTHDPQTGELNPYYEELTGEKNPMSISKEDNKKGNMVLLIDIDGTVSEDIKNEDSHLYATAEHFQDSLEVINKWYDEGNIITFFTARENKDREVTEKWLKDKGFKYHGLITDKPRIKDGMEYVWVDNRPVRGITYKGKWGPLIEEYKKIKTMGE